MTRATRFPRWFGIGLLAPVLVLGVLAQPAQVFAGFATSPDSPRVAAACDTGTHYPDAIITVRKAGGGPKEVL